MRIALVFPSVQHINRSCRLEYSSLSWAISIAPLSEAVELYHSQKYIVKNTDLIHILFEALQISRQEKVSHNVFGCCFSFLKFLAEMDIFSADENGISKNIFCQLLGGMQQEIKVIITQKPGKSTSGNLPKDLKPYKLCPKSLISDDVHRTIYND